MTQDLMTTTLAIWGACLGTIGTIISVVLAIREFKKDSHQIRISIDVSKNDPFWIISGMETKSYLVASVLNVGFRPTNVKTVTLISSDGIKIENGRLIKGEFPLILEASQAIDVYFEILDIRKALTSKKIFLKAMVVSDAAGHNWKSNVPKTIRRMI